MAAGAVSLWADIPALNHHLKREELGLSGEKRERRDGWHTNFRDDAVELATLVTEPALSSCEFAEVARGHWTEIIVELEDDSSGGFGVDGDVKL